MISVLYVDDEYELLELAKLFLEQSAEFHVDIRTSAKDVLASPQISSFDAIISDYQMPDMDGITFLKNIRATEGNIPFILFTGRGREEVVIEAINNGADFYIQKGGDVKAQFAELAHKIRQAVVRRKTEVSLIESEKRLSDIIDFLPDATFAVNRNGEIIAWNHAIETMTGLSADVMLEKGNYEYAIPFYGLRRPILIDLVLKWDDRTGELYKKISRDGEAITAETDLPHPKGITLAVLVKASPLYNRQGELTGAIESIRNITDLRSAINELHAANEKITASEVELREQLDILAASEQQVRENAARLTYMLGFYEKSKGNEKDLLNSAVEGAGIVTGSPLGYLAFLNEDESEMRMYAWTKSAMEECSIRKKPVIFPTAKTGLWGEAVRQRRPVITNDYASAEGKKGYPEGHPKIFRHMNIPVMDDGHVVIVAGVANKHEDYNGDDVRQLTILMQSLWQVLRQRKIEKDLHTSEAKYRALFEDSAIGIFRTNQDGRFSAVNATFSQIAGYDSPDQMIHEIQDIRRQLYVDPHDRDQFINALQSEGRVRDFTAQYFHKDGHPVWIRINAKAMYGHERKILYYEGTVEDISEQKKTELSLEKERSFSAAVIDSIPGLLYLYDSDSRLIRWNKAHETITGYSASELDGMQILELFKGDETAIREISGVVNRTFRDGQATAEAYLRTKAGKTIPFFFTAKRLEIDGHPYFTGVGIDITERNKAQDELRAAYEQITASEEELREQLKVLEESESQIRESEEKYRQVVEHSPLGMHFYELKEGNVLVFSGANPAADSILGISHDQFTGKQITDAFPDLGKTDIPDNYHRIARDGGTWQVNRVIYRGEGISGSFAVQAFQIRPGAMVAVFSDTTEQMMAEKALRDSEERFRRIADNAQDMIYRMTLPDGKYEYVSPAVKVMTGYSPEDWYANPLLLKQMIHPDWAGYFRDQWGELLAGNVPPTYEFQIIDRTGRTHWLNQRNVLIRQDDGRPIALEGIVTDVTRRKHTEKALHDMERLYHDIVDNSHDIIYTINPEGIMTFVSPSWTSNLGHQPDEIVGRNICEFIHEDDIAACREFLNNTLSSGITQPGQEFRIYNKDHSVRWYRTTLKAVSNDRGEIVTLIGNAFDFTEHRRSQDALRESERRYRSVIENIQDGLFRTNQEGRIVMASPSAARMFGYNNAGEILGHKITHFYKNPEVHQTIADTMNHNGKISDFTVELRQRDGSTFWGSINAHLLDDGSGSPGCMEGSIHDVTDRHVMEQAVREANRKLSLLNSITRHDVANQLTALEGFIQIASMIKTDPVVRDYLHKIGRVADTIAHQIEFTRTYQELGDRMPAWFRIETIISRAECRIPVRLSASCRSIEIFSDPLLERVFFNLFDNAVRHGARVTEITIRCEREPEGMIVIVEDDGIGIPLGEKEKIFERGFGRNTGLGLFLAKEILAITGIGIRETGIPGSGARFEISVPREAVRIVQ